jgi:hypothetical protein
VGELDTHKIFITGLIYVLNLSEDFGLPLPHGSLPLIPASVPPTHVREALKEFIEELGKVPSELELHAMCIVCDKPTLPTSVATVVTDAFHKNWIISQGSWLNPWEYLWR